MALNYCAICRNKFVEPCIECQAIETKADCTLSEGACSHIFHRHCINRWLQTRDVCPLDNSKWSQAYEHEMNTMDVIVIETDAKEAKDKT